jgi:UDP-N-acetylmuramate-alanine ligase
LEACEYKRHFLYLDLDYSIITNIKLDHTDYYKNEEDYFSAFDSLIQKTKRKVIVFKDLQSAQLKSYENNPKIEKIQIKNIDFEYVFGEQNIIDGNFAINLIENLSSDTPSNCPTFQALSSDIAHFK